MISAVSYYTIKQTALLDEKLLFFQFFIIFKTLQKPTELTGSDGSCQWFLRFLDFEFSMFKSLDEQPEAVAFIIENLDAISWSVGKDKKAVIKDIHLELGMHNECQPIYRLAHIHEMRWNVDILDFISVDDHLRAPMILSRSAGSNSIQWPSMVIDTLGWHHPQPRQEQINHFEVHHFPVVFLTYRKKTHRYCSVCRIPWQSKCFPFDYLWFFSNHIAYSKYLLFYCTYILNEYPQSC